ncbi:MAG TPA: hypothetical protein VMU13_02560 [Candidatus Paceibacterota bacterium]|nr:hypothetical protein [Candidatus Paceibacterota bacterium]
MKKRVASRKSGKSIGFADLNDKLDRVIESMATGFDDVRSEMVTGFDDIRSEMATKRDLQTLDEKFSKKFQESLLATEGLMKPISELKMEYTGMMLQLSRHETWIKLIAEKNHIKLPI